MDHDGVWDRYLQNYWRSQTPHNIYFCVLADHGFPGLFLYLGLIGSTYLSLLRLKWALRNKPEAEWLVNYCKMIQVSLTAFAIGGNFLPLSYWDYFYHLIGFAILLNAIAVKEGLLSPVPATAQLEPWKAQVGVVRA
jgi:O-antigen ligase